MAVKMEQEMAPPIKVEHMAPHTPSPKPAREIKQKKSKKEGKQAKGEESRTFADASFQIHYVKFNITNILLYMFMSLRQRQKRLRAEDAYGEEVVACVDPYAPFA